MSVKNLHLSISDRIIIEKGITNGSSKKSIADTLGKDKSTIGKEIKLHRTLSYKCNLPLECSNYKKCKHNRLCTVSCTDYIHFKCSYRDRSPGACNGCNNYSKCRFNKFKYNASDSDHEYRMSLINSRIGVNATRNQIKELGEFIKPLLDKGQSVYSILANHSEIKLSEKTIYNYIKNGVFQDAGVSITCLDLKRQVNRKVYKKKNVSYSPRKDKSYLKGRTYNDFENYMKNNPNASVVEMDTVYNDISNSPFIQTFKFRKYDLLFCVYWEIKDSVNMLNGILLLESILGIDLFQKEVEVILTDRGSEFILAQKAEVRDDFTRRTRLFYCDAMASWQKGSLENAHILLRDICPKKIDLFKLGLNSQDKANLISSHINSYSKEKLNGKSSFQLLEFLNPPLFAKLISFTLKPIPPDMVTLKPYLLKSN